MNYTFTKINFRKTLICVVVLAISLGIFFRFYNLDYKVYWYDEAITNLRLSGYSRAEFVNNEFTQKIIGLNDILKYQKLDISQGLLSTIESLTESIHLPLYFILLWFWTYIFGDSIYAIRAFSATISVLTFPVFFWLTSEIFHGLNRFNRYEKNIISWISVSLLAISPFQVIYAQEARMYSLLSFVIVLSCALLLYALRTKNKLAWLFYSFSLILGFYIHLFFFFNVIGHLFYVIWIEKFKISKAVVNYGISLTISLVAFLPWVLVIVNNLMQIQQTSSVKQLKLDLFNLMKFWIRDITRIFIDLQIGKSEYFAILVIALILATIFTLVFKSSFKSVAFIACLILSIVFPLGLSDLILGTNISTKSRYLFQLYLGIEIAIAYYFAFYLLSRKFLLKKMILSLYIITISIGLISCFDFSQNQVWWNKSFSKINYQIAENLNSVPNPLVLSNTHEFNVIDLLSLSHSLNSNVKFSLFLGLDFPEISEPQVYDQIFVYNMSEKLYQELEKKYLIEDIVYKLVTITEK